MLPLVVVTFLRPDPWVVPKLAVMLLIGVVALALLALGGVRAPVSLSAKILAVYLALFVLATVLSLDPARSLVGHQEVYQGLATALAYAVAFAAAAYVARDLDRLRGLLKAIVGAAAIVAVYGVLQQIGIDPLWHGLFGGLIFSTFGEHTSLGAYLALALPLAVGLTITSVGINRIAFGAASVAIVLALALAFSRGAYLGAVVALLVMGAVTFLGSSLNTRRVVIGAAVVAIVGVVILASPLSDLAARVTERAASTTDFSDLSIALHLDLWKVGTQMAVDRPLFGVGPDVFPIVFPQYRDQMLSPDIIAYMKNYLVESPHDVPIAIAVAAGIPALLAYLAFLGTALVAGLRALKSASRTQQIVIGSVIGACVGHFVTDLFMTADIAGSWTFWALLGILVAAASWTRSRTPEPEVAGKS